MAVTMAKEYYDWLCNKIRLSDKYINHTLLIGELFAKPYSARPWCEVDATRIGKTRELYDEFCNDSCCIIPPPITGEVSVLELLISLAEGVENIVMRDGELGDRTYVWFWDMIANLGLLQYDDDHFDMYSVREILDVFCTRRYSRSGRGSIAYTTRYTQDFRKLDVWQQVNIYCSEHYVMQNLMSIT